MSEIKNQINKLNATDRKKFEDIFHAYIFYYPLVITEITGTERIRRGEAEANVLTHKEGVATIEQNPAAGYNLDTVYSATHIDVSEEPILFTRSKEDRFVSLLICDANAIAVGVLGNGGIGGKDATKYVLYGPFYKGELPDGYIPVRLSTNHATGCFRVNTDGTKEDQQRVHEIQRRFDLRPLSKKDDPDFHTKHILWDAKVSSKSIPVKEIFSNIEDHFRYVNEALVQNPVVDEEQKTADQFVPYGIGPEKNFSLTQFDSKELVEALKLLPEYAFEWFEDAATLGNELINHTVYMPADLMLPGGDYFVRAKVSRWGVGANPAYAALYPNTSEDSDGDPLNSKEKYVIHINKDSFPPVNEDEGGYWSIHAYKDTELYLIPNEIRRHKLSSYDELVLDEDGGLTLYIQKEPVIGKYAKNWLPIDGDVINLMWRLYIPKEDAITRKWVVPPVQKA